MITSCCLDEVPPDARAYEAPSHTGRGFLRVQDRATPMLHTLSMDPGNSPAPPAHRDGGLAAVTARQQRQTMDLPPLAAPHG